MNVITVSEKSNRAKVASDIVLVNGWGITSGHRADRSGERSGAVAGGRGKQTHKILANLDIILKAAGLGRENVVAVRVYLVEAPRLLERLNVRLRGFLRRPIACRRAAWSAPVI